MPLKARTPDGVVICSLDFPHGFAIRDQHPRLLSPYPDVDVEVFPRDCEGKVLHFVHKSKSFQTEYKSHPESIAHIAGKLAVGKHYEKLIRDFGLKGRRVEFEAPIESRKRICDVCIKNEAGEIERVGEVQLAAITTDELGQRTKDYEALGIQVSWFLGGSADTSSNREWVLANTGVCWSI
jgi:competence CoiA-like predicted nuclease